LPFFFCQPVTDTDVAEAKERKKKRTEHRKVPLDVEVPGVSTAGTDTSMETRPRGSDGGGTDTEGDHDDEDEIVICDQSIEGIAAAVFEGDDSDASVHSAPSRNIRDSPLQEVIRTPVKAHIFLNPSSDGHETPTVDDSDGLTSVLSPAGAEFPIRVNGGNGDLTLPLPEISSDVSLLCLVPVSRIPPFVIPEDRAIEESKEEIGTAEHDMDDDLLDDDLLSTLPLPIPLVRRESFATVTSEYTSDDDSTGDNVCPICLSGCNKGDIIIVSKYCTHAYHKECILEWLEKHDECPCCRAAMVTDSEMSRVATNLVGKMRMYRAVASLNAAQPRTSPPSPGHPSPFGGTVRRVASLNTMNYHHPW
jgi:Ring finger domain